MKLMCVILPLAILLAGCYSQTTLTKDTQAPPSGTEVTFRLRNGIEIVSSEYQRIENGYHIVGRWNSGDYDGFVPDGIISEMFFTEFDTAKTVVVVALGVGIPVAIFISSVSLPLKGANPE